MKKLFLLAFVLVAFTLESFAANRVALRFLPLSADANTAKVRVAIQAKNMEGVDFNASSWTVRFTYNDDVLDNPQVLNAAPGHSIMRQPDAQGRIITSYGIFSFHAPSAALQATAQWTTIGVVEFDLVNYVSGVSQLDLVFQRQTDVVPSVSTEFVQIDNQPLLDIIDFQDYSAGLDHMMFTGVNEIDQNVAISLTPNPATSFVVIDINVVTPTSDTYVVEFMDITGRKVMAKTNVTEGNNTINLSKMNLAAGVYLVQVSNEKGQALSQEKLVVQ